LANVTIGATSLSIVVGDSQLNEPSTTRGKLNSPFGIDFDAAGTMYIVELTGGRVHKMTAAGTFSTIAGDGSQGYSGDGGPAKRATFNGMHNVAVTPSGDLYIADSWNHCLRQIDGKTGIITTIAGTGEPGFSGDGGPAKQAQFDFLMCVSLDSSNGKIYCADLRNLRIRVVDLTTGSIQTVAGNGTKGVPMQGARATDSPLVDPRAVAADSQGNVYVLEREGHALRVVTPEGIIRTVAGTGQKGDAVGPALQSQFGSPKHLAIDRDDNVIIADEQNDRLVKYDAKADTVTAILGTGVANPKCALSQPHGVCVHKDGSIYVVDSGHHRILRLQLR
jgi:sugar lactone lactonase YvrE